MASLLIKDTDIRFRDTTAEDHGNLEIDSEYVTREGSGGMVEDLQVLIAITKGKLGVWEKVSGVDNMVVRLEISDVIYLRDYLNAAIEEHAQFQREDIRFLIDTLRREKENE